MLAGVVPFLLGSLVKSALGAAILMALARRTNNVEQA
jgi:biotin transport system substrate-specific component